MKISKIKRRDDATIINKKFGKLLVLKYVYSKNQQRHFECLCECGNTKILPKGLLKFGSVKSCGCSKAYRDMNEIFQLNTEKIGDCLEWIGTKTHEGYGRFKFQRKVYSAHRAHWELNIGTIPEGMIVGHHCDNRGCVRIEHLFLAPPSHNSKDMVRKGRQAKGVKNGSSKLNDAQVKDILTAHEEIKISDLAKKYNVCHTTIRRILNQETWKHIQGGLDQNKKLIKDMEPSNQDPKSSHDNQASKINSRLRAKVLMRDKSICSLCGTSPTKDPSIKLHVDHIIPRSKNGKNDIENLQTLCSLCNLGKSAEMPKD